MRDNRTKVMSTKEVAQLLDISPRRVQELAAAGQIPSVRPKGHRKWLFLRSVVARYMGLDEEDL